MGLTGSEARQLILINFFSQLVGMCTYLLAADHQELMAIRIRDKDDVGRGW